MTITLGAFNFGNPSHGALRDAPFEQQVATHSWFGIIGELHLISKNTGRVVEVDVMLFNAATETVLRTALDAIHQKQGTHGTLTVNSIDYPNVTFLGFHASEPPFLEGSGQLLWCIRGVLKFRQVAA